MNDQKEPVGKESVFMLALGVFFVLFGGVVCLALFYDFSPDSLGVLLFFASLLCCIFIARNLYDLALSAQEKKQAIIPEPIEMTGQSLYTQLYQKSPVPYFVIDANGYVVSANTSAARILGIPQKKIIGLELFNRLRLQEEDRTDFLINKFQSGVGTSGEVVRVVRDDHREAWGLLSLFQFSNDYGERQGLLTLVDITKQKKAEDAKSEFVSLASHQLRTPIAGMKWSTELLELDSPDTLTENQKKYLRRLYASINRLSLLVDDFLRVSRFELGGFYAEYETVALQKLFSDVVMEMSDTARHKNLHIETDFDESVQSCITDPNLLRMIVTNLYSNAVKYTPVDGQVTVRYKHEQHMLKIQVSDTGMGIPTQDQENIFSKLFRASNAVRDVPDGTGLGLYIVREAVSVLRGKVSFTSAEQVGTTFEVQIPFEAPE